MVVDGLRFLHAGELNLGVPLFGVGGLPYHLRSMMVSARYRAAERVFAAAIEQRVDFVLLVGGVFGDSTTGPRASWFLAAQCEALRRHGIPVYWFESPAVSNRWSDYVPLPANVFVGDPQTGQSFEYARNGRTVARIVIGGEGAAGPADPEVPQIAVLPEGLDGLPLSPMGVDYWALGGRLSADTAPSLCGLAQFAGTTHGHSPLEGGPRGCALVTIDRHRNCTSEFVETEAVRWHDERVRVSGDLDWGELRQELAHRQNRLLEQSRCDLVMIRWTLTGHGALWQQLRRDDVCRQLQSMLVRAGLDRQPAAWSFVIDLAPDAEQLAVWSTEESPFGDAARQLRGGQRSMLTAPPEPHFHRVAAGRSAQRVQQHVGN
jgi:DNA repair exonuclease SbcCD nuclease subunit